MNTHTIELVYKGMPRTLVILIIREKKDVNLMKKTAKISILKTENAPEYYATLEIYTENNEVLKNIQNNSLDTIIELLKDKTVTSHWSLLKCFF